MFNYYSYTYCLWVDRIHNGCLSGGFIHHQVHVIVFQCWDDVDYHVTQVFNGVAGMMLPLSHTV